MKVQCGAAILLAMLVLAVCTALVTGLIWRQSVLVSELESRAALSQTRLLMRGALDWVRVILREDGRASNVDHLGEPWSVPLSETRLDSDDGEFALLSGTIADEQGKFNLRNLIDRDATEPNALRQFEQLLRSLGVDAALGNSAARRLLASGPSATGRATGVPVLILDDLLGTPGWGAAQIERLRDFVTILPNPTVVNVNTATSAVLAAWIPGLNPSDGATLVAHRDTVYFRDTADFWNRVATFGVDTRTAHVQTSTQYFLLRGQISYRNALMRLRALLHRNNGRVSALWWREEPV